MSPKRPISTARFDCFGRIGSGDAGDGRSRRGVGPNREPEPEDALGRDQPDAEQLHGAQALGDEDRAAQAGLPHAFEDVMCAEDVDPESPRRIRPGLADMRDGRAVIHHRRLEIR